jgi:hypothetical protein
VPLFNKYELRQVTERKDGAIFKTKILGYEWYEAGKGPECYKALEGDRMYVPTLDTKVGPECPKSEEIR